MKSNLKFFLYGILILFAMIMYWLLILYINNQIIIESDEKSDSFFYLSIIISFNMWFFLVFTFYGSTDERNIGKLLILGLPYVSFQLIMQALQINIPRIYDVFILSFGLVLIYLIYKWNISLLKRILIALSFCVFISVTYTIVYKNIWNYVKSRQATSFSKMDFNFKIKDINGVECEIKDFKGKVICVDMWSSSCGNCIASMPDFEKLNLRFKADTNYKLVSLYCPINESQTYTWFIDYINRKFNYEIDFYYIEYSDFKRLGIKQFPEFFILNRRFELKYRGQVMYENYVENNIYNRLEKINENDNNTN